MRGDVGEDAGLGGEIKGLADMVEHAKEGFNGGNVVGGGIDADDGVTVGIDQTVDNGSRDTPQVVGGVVGLEAGRKTTGETKSVAETGNDTGLGGNGNEVLYAHDFRDGGDHLRGETKG